VKHQRTDGLAWAIALLLWACLYRAPEIWALFGF
jgi:hypothetical protein